MRRLLGTDEAQPGIRDIVNRETAVFVYEDEAFIDKLLFWRKKRAPGIVVDAEKEKKRLQIEEKIVADAKAADSEVCLEPLPRDM